MDFPTRVVIENQPFPVVLFVAQPVFLKNVLIESHGESQSPSYRRLNDYNSVAGKVLRVPDKTFARPRNTSTGAHYPAQLREGVNRLSTTLGCLLSLCVAFGPSGLVEQSLQLNQEFQEDGRIFLVGDSSTQRCQCLTFVIRH